MHELALAESIANIVEKERLKNSFSKVLSVYIKLGSLHEIVPDALQFGFDSLTQDTPLAGANLKIEQIPIKGRCRQCSHEFVIEEFLFICGSCYSGDIEVIEGDELLITHIDVE